MRDAIAAGGPWYGLQTAEEVRRSVGGYGTADDDVVSLSLAHEFRDGFVSVETEQTDEVPPAEAEWDALGDVLENYIVHGPVHPVATEEVPQRDAPSFPISLHITRDEIDVVVDGVPVQFVRVGDPTRWVAWARMGERTVKIRSWNWPPDRLTLASVEPLSTYEMDEFAQPVLWQRFDET